MALEALLLVVLLVGSAFFSGSETAIFSLSRYELTRLTRERSRTGWMVAELVQHPRRLLLTLMIGNVTMNMFIFAVGVSLFRKLAGDTPGLGALLGLITPIIVTIGADILPKSIALLLRWRVAPLAAPIIRTVQVALSPVIYVLLHLLVAPLTRLLAGTTSPDEYVTTEELDELIELSERHRIIDADENAMLGEVIRLSEMKVYDVMVPRVDMIAFDVHDDPGKLRQMMRERRFTKIPVYDATIDNIIGVVYAKDLFLNPSREPGTLVRPVRYVPEMITLMQLIEHFRRTQTQLAIAVNEHGEIAGLVTIEDVAMQIVGDITFDGRGEDVPSWTRVDDRRYRVAGRINIHDWSDQFNFRGIEDSVSTLAGLIQARLGRLPEVGDQVHLGNLTLTVESLDGRRVQWVMLQLHETAEQAAESAESAPSKEVRR